METGKNLFQNTFISSRMLIESLYMVIFKEIYIYFRVIYLLENCHRLSFSIVDSYVYYEFIKLYL